MHDLSLRQRVVTPVAFSVLVNGLLICGLARTTFHAPSPVGTCMVVELIASTPVQEEPDILPTPPTPVERTPVQHLRERHVARSIQHEPTKAVAQQPSRPTPSVTSSMPDNTMTPKSLPARQPMRASSETPTAMFMKSTEIQPTTSLLEERVIDVPTPEKIPAPSMTVAQASPGGGGDGGTRTMLLDRASSDKGDGANVGGHGTCHSPAGNSGDTRGGQGSGTAGAGTGAEPSPGTGGGQGGGQGGGIGTGIGQGTGALPTTASAPPKRPSTAAAIARQTKPRYPISARRDGVEGSVVIHVSLSAKGKVEDVAVGISSGDNRLDIAALQAVKRWGFSPRREDGEAVPSTLLVRVTFSLRDAE